MKNYDYKPISQNVTVNINGTNTHSCITNKYVFCAIPILLTDEAHGGGWHTINVIIGNMTKSFNIWFTSRIS